MPAVAELFTVPKLSPFVFPSEPRKHPAEGMRSAAKSAAQPSFEELCKPHEQKLLQMTLRITRNREDAEDALQDAMLQAYVHMDQFDGRSSFGTWITRIAINSSLMMLRKRRRARMVSLEGSAEDGAKLPIDIVDHAAGPEQRCLENERCMVVREAIGLLRPALRKAVQLQQLEERSMSESAKAMGISVCATKGRLFHAKAALRKSRKLKVYAGKVKGSLLPPPSKAAQTMIRQTGEPRLAEKNRRVA